MSDKEDIDLVHWIEEIEALKCANMQIGSKENTDNDQYASTSAVLDTKVLPKFEEKFENNSKLYENKDTNMNNDQFIIHEVEDDSDDQNYDNYSCDNLQDLLALNIKVSEVALNTRDKMEKLLEECQRRQQLLTDEINNHPCSLQAKIIHLNAGMPYFKDSQYFTAQRNEDTETKIRNGELSLAQLQRINRWNQVDKNNLLKAISHEVTVTVLKKEEPDKDYIDNTIKKTGQLPPDVKKAIGPLGSTKFDWMKIAADIPENKHSADESEVMWNVFLHPDINKQKWTTQEERNLNRIAEEYGFEDWDTIAKKLNTNRSGYQCFVRYNTRNWKNLMKGQFWTPMDDRTLNFLVSKLKIGDYIPWGYIASCINHWTKQQIYFRWTYSLAPHLKKGRFSKEENDNLLTAVSIYGLNFSKISALIMTNRTNVQLKEHYQTLMSKTGLKKKVWTLEEDELLIRLRNRYGADWAKIVKEMPSISRVQARQRHASLVRFQQKGIRLTDINREEDVSIPPTHTTVTFTTNSPWSRENREIHVKHLKVDDQLVNFFRQDNELKKQQTRDKAYLPHKLQEDTKKLYDTLLKLNVNVNVPNYVDDNNELTEKYLQLLSSLHNYVKDRRENIDEKIERVRLQMFGPQEPVPAKQRFVPPLPFNFQAPRSKTSNSRNSSVIDCTPNTDNSYQIKLTMEWQPTKEVAEYLGEDVEIQFEKLKKLITKKTQPPLKFYPLKCKEFASSSFFYNPLERYTVQKNNVFRSPVKTNMRYDWKLNRMVPCDSSFQETPVTSDSVPISIIEPSRTTLNAYQELLLTSTNFPEESISTDNEPSYTLSARGREALSTFKRRFQQLFNMPTGLSRIIPPDVVDESAFLPVLEKLKKKNSKYKRPKKVIKVVNTRYFKKEAS